MRIAAYINTWNRVEPAVKTIRGLEFNSVLPHSLTVVDDASTEENVATIRSTMPSNGGMWSLGAHAGQGQARLVAIGLFANSNADIGMFFDSDVIFSHGFDATALGLWLAHRGKHMPCLGSAYRSSADGQLKGDKMMNGYVLGNISGGLSLIMDKAMAQMILAMVPQKEWDWEWDWHLFAKIPRVIKPVKSLLDHMQGTTADSCNTVVRDTGFGFPP